MLSIIDQLDEIIVKATALEHDYKGVIDKVHPAYQDSAINLTHYLAFRSFDIDKLQEELRETGLPDLADIEAHVMKSLFDVKSLVNYLSGNPKIENQRNLISIQKSNKLLRKNTKRLFGYKSKKRRTRIMVTLPSSAADDYTLVNHLVQLGMNSARINCAHDNPEVWDRMIEHVDKANQALHKKCKVMMDLGGPKLRTGKMHQGPMVIHIRPHRDEVGKVVKSAKIWIAPPGVPPPNDTADAIIPVSAELIEKIHHGDILRFIDSRGKNCKIKIKRQTGEGKWASCRDSAYVTTGTELSLSRVEEKDNEKRFVGELVHKEQYITLHVGDKLILHGDPRPGEATQFDVKGKLVQHAHISCTLPEVFQHVKENEPVFLNDGKIEAVIEKSLTNELHLRITYAKILGSKLRADKGINFPESELQLSGLTEKDKRDIPFVAYKADAVNLSFVNQVSDVQQYLQEIGQYDAKPGLILKIETKKGFNNLPEILMEAMQTYPIGVMIARGDLAIETGWKNFASIQEEIMRISEAALIPVVWATQVLDNLAKKGVPTRAEITDAALAQRTECVMLNKGAYIEKTVKTLDKILRRMQKFQHKKQTLLPRLKHADKMRISHDEFNV